MNDYEISKKVQPKNILEIGKKLSLKKEDLLVYGNDKAKLNVKKESLKKEDGKLILVTSTSPTPYGEGKTTLAIGIHDALCKLGMNSLVVLREPSLGPVFGTKGGATGGGMSQVIPMDDINLHFTGDIHAITSANNLLAAVIDNHLFHKTDLNLDPKTIVFERCMDMNDRSLRTVQLSNVDRLDHFNISTASELMAILCLSEDENDLKMRLENIYIGDSYEGKKIYAKDLNCVGAMLILLKDAIKPNLVQTLEGNPALIHGGPFANIAHGCNSVIATKLGLKLASYVITEAGFGSDMGGLKFFDIKCRISNLNPDLVIINATIRGLKYNGNGDLKTGLSNLNYHISNMQQCTNNLLVVLNKFEEDTELEIEMIKDYCNEKNVPFEMSDCYKSGSNGGLEVAKKILDLANQESQTLSFSYEIEDTLQEKIEKLCKKHYFAKQVLFSDNALKKVEKYKNEKLPICIAKTQYSITDNPKILGFPKDHTMTVTDIKLNHGAGFITVFMGNIMTMPGLSKTANYINMDYSDNKISGLF